MKAKKFIYLFLFLTLSVPTLTFANNKDNNLSKDYILVDKIIAVVNGKPVLKSELKLFQKFYNIQDEKKALNELINQILISQTAKNMGITASQEEINRYILDLAKRNNMNSIEELKEVFEREGIAFSEFKDLIKRQILVGKFTHQYLREKFLEATEEGKVEKSATVRVLYLSKNSPDFEEKYKKVKSLLYKEPFSKLVKTYSDDETTKENGGLLKNIKEGFLNKEIDKKLWGYRKGDIFEVNTDDGVFFIKVEGIEKKFTDDIDNKKLEEKIKKEIDLLIQKLKENSVIKYIN
ncbi:MAG: peptidylprolyl isomerase [Persephonella sp.]|nr:MAG: peptidylprolyl isomerase [Persephonella sp.]